MREKRRKRAISAKTNAIDTEGQRERRFREGQSGLKSAAFVHRFADERTSRRERGTQRDKGASGIERRE